MPHTAGIINNRNLFLTVLRLEVQDQEPAWSSSGEDPPSRVQTIIPLCVLTWWEVLGNPGRPPL